MTRFSIGRHGAVPALIAMVAVGSLGCTEDLTPATLIDRTRILAAQVTVDGDANQVFPAPGEQATVSLTVEGFDPEAGLTWRVYGCRSAPVRTGIPLCALGPADSGGAPTPAPIFAGDGAAGFLEEWVQVDERAPTPPTFTFTLAGAVPPDRGACFDTAAPDDASFPEANVLLTGAVCGPGAIPVEPPFIVAFRGLIEGTVDPDELDLSDPDFFSTRCVSVDEGTATRDALMEEETFAFNLPVRLDEPTSPTGSPPPSAQGNRPPVFPTDLPPGQKPFALGQGEDLDCFPGFDNQNAGSIEDALAVWPETDAEACDDAAFPEEAVVAFEENVCIGVRVPSPADGGDASEIFDPDGEGWCLDPQSDAGGTPGDRPPRREDLLLSHFATAGELQRQFSRFDVETEDDGTPLLDGAFERNPAFLEWSPPAKKDDVEIPPEGLLVEFTFVLRDGREGMGVARRKLCVLPPVDGP